MKNNRQSGQVLLIGVIAMLIILVAVFILFDLGNVIRGKVKAQNAVDAAALVGANWQRHTLNLVGELNLVKACSVLITDEVFGIGKSTDEFLKVQDESDSNAKDASERWGSLKTASDTVSQMQQRALFIVPLIGFGAAQQAAKNNGLSYNQDYADALLEQLNMVRGSSDNSSLYQPYTTEDFIKKQLYGYDWKPSYVSVLSDILQENGDESKGIAVLPNAQLLGAPRLRTFPPTSNDFAPILQTRRLYDAISANYWCWLRDVLRMDFSKPGWWGNLILDEDNSFKRESEFLPVNVEIRDAQRNLLDSLVQQGIMDQFIAKNSALGTPLNQEYDSRNPVFDSNGKIIPSADTDQKLDPLPAIDWAYYGWKWRKYDEGIINQWGNYLIAPFQKQVQYYSGAVSRMDTEFTPVTVSGTMGIQDQGPSDGKTLGEGFGVFTSNSANKSLNRFSNAQKRMRSGLQTVGAYTVAKPFGQLEINGEVSPPYLSSIVLPVFDHSAIIPASLENPGRNPLADYEWYKFLMEYLPALGKVSNLDSMPANLISEHPWRHNMLKKLDDSAWRQEGLNWLTTPKMVDDPDNPGKQIQVGTNEDDCTYWDGGGDNTSHPPSLH